MIKKDRDIGFYLEDIIESSEKIAKYIGGLNKSALEKNQLRRDAVHRRLGIIGEAVKQLPQTLRDKHPKIPWKKIAGTRDVIIHDYEGVVDKIVWNIIKSDLPKLKKQVEKILEELDKT